MTYEQWLVSRQLISAESDAALLTPEQSEALRAAYEADRAAKAEVQDAGDDGGQDTESQPSAPESFAAVGRELARRLEIKAAFAEARAKYGHDEELTATLAQLERAATADPSVTVEAVRSTIFRETHRNAPMAVVRQSQQQNDGLVLEAAIAGVLRLRNREKYYPEAVLSAADRYGRMTLLELVHECASANGWRGRHVRHDLRDALRYAMGVPSVSAIGPSTISVAGILSNVANKMIREAFLGVEAAWRQIAAVKSVNDFKTHYTYSLVGDLAYKKVPPGGEIEHGTLGEVAYQNRADTYGRLLGIDRRDLINDDLGAFEQVATRLGRGAATTLNHVFWTEFLDHATFFSLANNNFAAGATTTLMDLTGLQTAYSLFSQQTDPDGLPVAIEPAIVLVPISLWAAASSLLTSIEHSLASPSPNGTIGQENPWRGRFRLVASRYLQLLPGGSALAWYMLADPAELPVIEVCFLNGQEVPTIESSELDFERLGIAMRGYHDFGVAKQEYRGGVKMKGEA